MPEPTNHGELSNSVRRRRERLARRERDGQGSLAKDLAWMGGIAWLVVGPLLLGAFLGRMLDRALGTGIASSATLIFLGACLGGWLAWRRVQGE